MRRVERNAAVQTQRGPRQARHAAGTVPPLRPGWDLCEEDAVVEPEVAVQRAARQQLPPRGRRHVQRVQVAQRTRKLHARAHAARTLVRRREQELQS